MPLSEQDTRLSSVLDLKEKLLSAGFKQMVKDFRDPDSWSDGLGAEECLFPTHMEDIEKEYGKPIDFLVYLIPYEMQVALYEYDEFFVVQTSCWDNDDYHYWEYGPDKITGDFILNLDYPFSLQITTAD